MISFAGLLAGIAAIGAFGALFGHFFAAERIEGLEARIRGLEASMAETQEASRENTGTVNAPNKKEERDV